MVDPVEWERMERESPLHPMQAAALGMGLWGDGEGEVDWVSVYRLMIQQRCMALDEDWRWAYEVMLHSHAKRKKHRLTEGRRRQKKEQGNSAGQISGDAERRVPPQSPRLLNPRHTPLHRYTVHLLPPSILP